LYGPEQAAALRDAVQNNRAVLDTAYGRLPGASRTFETVLPVSGMLEVATRVRDLHGEAGPAVLCEPLEIAMGRVWRVPPKSLWHAVSAGAMGRGQRVVLRVNVPAAFGEGRPRNVSLQIPDGEGAHPLRIHATRTPLERYLVAWTAAFGPLVEFTAVGAPSPDTDVTGFLG